MNDHSLDIAEAIRRARQLHQSGQWRQAEQLYRRILDADPNHADANHLLGVLAYQAGNLDAAAKHISRAVLSDGDQAPYYNSLGLVLQAQGNAGQAELLFKQAIATDPGYAEAFDNLGNLLKTLGRFEEALAACDQALAVNPGRADPHNNRGLVLHKLGRLGEALEAFEHAISLEPGFAEAYNNLGNTLQSQGRIADALAAYRQALSCDPSFAGAYSNLLLCMNYDAGTSADTLFAAHRGWNDRYGNGPAVAGKVFRNSPDPQRPLRLGYVSADFCRHPVASFIEPVLAAHDPDTVAVVCYANNSRQDDVTERLRALAGKWRHITGLPDEEVARLIQEDGIDILVDLSGHTAGNRLGVFARKPAPVQVTYLGYPSTSGLSAMDYRLSDRWLDPPGLTEDVHAEEIIRLTGGGLCFKPPVADTEPGAAPSITAPRITFASFNNLAKVTPAVIDLWCEVLSALPESRLLLKSKSLGDAATTTRLKTMFSDRGIADERLEFVGWTASHRDHLALYDRVHIGLDTFPYSGCTTTCEALWMGVPVITLAGNESRSRMSLAILKQVGLDNLVAETPEAFVTIARDLARDREKLQALRTGLRGRLEKASLCDAAAFTRSLETAYRAMWQRWCAKT